MNFKNRDKGHRDKAKSTQVVSLSFSQVQWIKIMSLQNDHDLSASNVVRMALRNQDVAGKEKHEYNMNLMCTVKEARELKSQAYRLNMSVAGYVRKAINEI